MEIFHTARRVPTNSCILLATARRGPGLSHGRHRPGLLRRRAASSATPRSTPKLTEYSGRYEETQGFSPTFQRFHRDLADRLIERFKLQDRDILEIGCGKGEFLLLLCENGRNRGVGYDPGYRADRHAPAAGENVRFVADFYTEKCTDTAADFVCCKMTLEHIPDTLEFMRMVRAAQGDRHGRDLLHDPRGHAHPARLRLRGRLLRALLLLQPALAGAPVPRAPASSRPRSASSTATST